MNPEHGYFERSKGCGGFSSEGIASPLRGVVWVRREGKERDGFGYTGGYRGDNGYSKIENLKELIIEIRGQSVLFDSDVAELYGVETKRINEAVKNNPEKFPDGYIMELNKSEWDSLKSKFSTSIKGGKVKLPGAFTEKGLYMLAAILKSPQAIKATLSIIETFSKIRELSRSIKKLSTVQDKADQKSLMQKSGELIAEIFDDDLQTKDTETTIELNFAVLKFKYARMPYPNSKRPKSF